MSIPRNDRPELGEAMLADWRANKLALELELKLNPINMSAVRSFIVSDKGLQSKIRMSERLSYNVSALEHWLEHERQDHELRVRLAKIMLAECKDLLEGVDQQVIYIKTFIQHNRVV